MTDKKIKNWADWANWAEWAKIRLVRISVSFSPYLKIRSNPGYRSYVKSRKTQTHDGTYLKKWSKICPKASKKYQRKKKLKIRKWRFRRGNFLIKILLKHIEGKYFDESQDNEINQKSIDEFKEKITGLMKYIAANTLNDLTSSETNKKHKINLKNPIQQHIRQKTRPLPFSQRKPFRKLIKGD